MRYYVGIRGQQPDVADTWEQAWRLFEEQVALAIDEAVESGQVSDDKVALMRAEHAALFRPGLGDALGRDALYLFGVRGKQHYLCPENRTEAANWTWA